MAMSEARSQRADTTNSSQPAEGIHVANAYETMALLTGWARASEPN